VLELWPFRPRPIRNDRSWTCSAVTLFDHYRLHILITMMKIGLTSRCPLARDLTLRLADNVEKERNAEQAIVVMDPHRS
jgi:hypothetical protein